MKDRSLSIEDVKDIYSDEAESMAKMDFLNRLFSGRYRSKIFSDASGSVLDIAAGTGINIHYLPENCEYTGIDISREVLEEAEEKVDRLELGKNIRMMDAQDLDFEDNSFDTVISALSTCTFPEPIKALNEMYRVCKPEGEILLFEHGESSFGPFQRFQHWRAEAHYEKHGCRWTQEPLDLVEESELKIIESSKHFFGMITLIRAGKDK